MNKLGSAPSFEEIQKVIRKFYAGESKELRLVEPCVWSVHKSDGAQLSTRVRLHKGRYLFESL